MAGPLLLVCAAPAAATAQLPAQWPDDGFVAGIPTTVVAATTACVTELLWPASDTVTELRCRVASVDTVDLAVGSRVLLGRYERWVRHSAIPWQDSVQVDELVLFDVTADRTRASPVWRRLGFEYYLAPAAWGRAGGIDLLEVPSCFRGTGGCMEELLMRDGGAWREVELRFLDELGAHLPDGHRLHKGLRIDLSTLDFEQPIATETDANCCPSAALVGTLRLDGTILRLDSVRLEPRSG